jgi:hypothetical protein
MRVVGCDPGFGGALALLEDGRLVEVVDMPLWGGTGKPVIDMQRLCALLEEWRPDQVVMEGVGPAPGQGLGSTFRFGYAAGQVHGLVLGLGLVLARVAPGVWKAELRLPGGKVGKAKAREMASHLWPSGDWFKRVKDDGRAEAALIAHWSVLHGGPLAVPRQRVEAAPQR